MRTLKSRTKYHPSYYTKYWSLEEVQDVEDIANKVDFKEKWHLVIQIMMEFRAMQILYAKVYFVLEK